MTINIIVKLVLLTDILFCFVCSVLEGHVNLAMCKENSKFAFINLCYLHFKKKWDSSSCSLL